jgi:two-component system, OmpR family, sensor histidine kinase VicK
VFGDDYETFIGQSILEPFSQFIPDIHERFELALQGKETSSTQIVGDVILDVRYSPLRRGDGEVMGIIGVATDITERLKAERLQIELEKEQEVIALKERLITTASHDFRTPLTIMKMSVNILEKYFDRLPAEQRRAKLQQVSKQIDQLVQLLDDFLLMSKANAGKLEVKPHPVALKSFCEQILDNFRHTVETTHRLDFVYDCSRDNVVIDPTLLHYILINLLSNAIKYSPTNGYVRFEVECNTDDLILRVIDNGIGIPKEDQAKLFEPFHRAANTTGISGTGLGLSIVKSYVNAHHGRIEVESTEGAGTTFTVCIPVNS